MLLYRQLLVAARALRTVDDQCGAVMAWFVRSRFAKYRPEVSSRLRLQYLRQGRKHLRLLRRAQCTGAGGEKAMEKVVAYSYGTRGKLRHILRHRVHEVKSRRNVEPPKRMSSQVHSLPPAVLPLLRYCEAEALKLVAPGAESGVYDNNKMDVDSDDDVALDERGGPSIHGVRLEGYVRGKFQWWGNYGGNGVPIAQTAAVARSSESIARKKRLYERALGMTLGSLEFDGVEGNTIELVKMQLEHIPVTVDEFFTSPLTVASKLSDLGSKNIR